MCIIAELCDQYLNMDRFCIQGCCARACATLLLCFSLYNKESLLEFLLQKNTIDKFSHIRGLKDVKELNLTDNPAFSRKDGKIDVSDAALYVCPVTGLEMSGKHR